MGQFSARFSAVVVVCSGGGLPASLSSFLIGSRLPPRRASEVDSIRKSNFYVDLSIALYTPSLTAQSCWPLTVGGILLDRCHSRLRIGYSASRLVGESKKDPVSPFLDSRIIPVLPEWKNFGKRSLPWIFLRSSITNILDEEEVPYNSANDKRALRKKLE